MTDTISYGIALALSWNAYLKGYIDALGFEPSEGDVEGIRKEFDLWFGEQSKNWVGTPGV